MCGAVLRKPRPSKWLLIMVDVKLEVNYKTYLSVYRTFGLLYLSSDNIFEAPTKGFESTSYIDEPGEHIYNKTVAAAFDYKIKFLIEAPNKNIVNANDKIKAFNDAFRTIDGDGVQTIHKITLYNTYKRAKIVGYPTPINTATTFFRDNKGVVHDAVEVELTIHVANPGECDFNLQDNSVTLYGSDLSHVWYGTGSIIYGPEYSETWRGLKIPIKEGDAISLRTRDQSEAHAWTFSIDGRTIQSTSEVVNALQDYELVSPISGWLFVNCRTANLNNFYLTITPTNTISTQDDTTNL